MTEAAVEQYLTRHPRIRKFAKLRRRALHGSAIFGSVVFSLIILLVGVPDVGRSNNLLDEAVNVKLPDVSLAGWTKPFDNYLQFPVGVVSDALACPGVGTQWSNEGLRALVIFRHFVCQRPDIVQRLGRAYIDNHPLASTILAPAESGKDFGYWARLDGHYQVDRSWVTSDGVIEVQSRCALEPIEQCVELNKVFANLASSQLEGPKLVAASEGDLAIVASTDTFFWVPLKAYLIAVLPAILYGHIRTSLGYVPWHAEDSDWDGSRCYELTEVRRGIRRQWRKYSLVRAIRQLLIVVSLIVLTINFGEQAPIGISVAWCALLAAAAGLAFRLETALGPSWAEGNRLSIDTRGAASAITALGSLLQVFAITMTGLYLLTLSFYLLVSSWGGAYSYRVDSLR